MYVSIVKAQSSLAVGSFIFLFFYFYFIFNFIWSDYFALKKKRTKKKENKNKKQNKQLCVRCHRLGSVNFGRWFIHFFAFLFLFLLFIYLSSIIVFFLQKQQESIVSIHKVNQHNTKEEL